MSYRVSISDVWLWPGRHLSALQHQIMYRQSHGPHEDPEVVTVVRLLSAKVSIGSGAVDRPGPAMVRSEYGAEDQIDRREGSFMVYLRRSDPDIENRAYQL